MTKAIYPGSFDPITFGHLDIIRRASRIFDGVVVATTDHYLKEHIFPLDKRVAIIRECVKEFPNVDVAVFSGLLVKFASEVGAKVIIRGLREAADFENEFQMAVMNKLQEDGIETIFLASSAAYFFISSSLIREVASLDGDLSKVVPQIVADEIRAIYKGDGKTG
jgi:pantetheine-phosphate adenylyltransferase